LNFILPYLKRYRLSLILAPIMVMIGVIADLAMPTLMADMVDRGIARGDLNLVLLSGLKMLLFALLGMAAGTAGGYYSSKAAVGGSAALREDLFRKIQSLSYANLDKLKISDLITRLTSDVSQIERMIQFSLKIILRAPLKIMGSLIMAVIIGGQLSLIVAVISPLIIVTIALLVHLAYPLFDKVQTNLDQLNRRLQENLSGVRLVKAFCREKDEEARFAAVSRDLAHSTTGANRLMALMHPLMRLFMNGSVIAALWWGGVITGGEGLPVGKLMAFINYLTQMLFMLILISNMIIQFSRAQVSLDRIKEIMAEKADVANRPEAVPPTEGCGTLAFENVSFRYGERSDQVLENITFTVHPGEVIALMGPTGSGKSTLARLIPRFYDVSSGRITQEGRDIRDLDVKKWRQKTALVSQTPLLFSGSIEKNILFGKADKNREVMVGAAKDAGAEEFIKPLPKGYDTDVNQRGVNFSGGQKQRISLARALAREPDILILDDTTSAVDLKTEENILNSLMERREGKITLIIAQKISTVKKADKILLIEKGRIKGWGRHEELWETSPLYRDICSSQSEKEII
jgi:ATP-binding cassette, subfamily B, multidrug efflux pump